MSEVRFALTRSGRAAQPEAPPTSPAEKPAAAGESAGGCGCASGARPTLRGKTRRVAVNGREIDAEAIAQEMQNHPAADPEESWREAARALAVRELLLEEARRRGVEAHPESLQPGKRETEEESLIRALLEAAVEPVAPDEAECRRVYRGMRSRFVTPRLYEAAHILLEPAGDDDAAWADAEAEAKALIAMVGDNPRVFADTAQARSACPTANQGGSLGQVRRGELAAPVQAALDTLEEGRTAKAPVRSRFGWHVVRLERRIEGRDLPYEVVGGKIRDMLEARSWAVAAAQFVAGLAAAATLEGVEIAPPDAGFASCAEGGGC